MLRKMILLHVVLKDLYIFQRRFICLHLFIISSLYLSHFKQISAICLLSFIYFPVKIKKWFRLFLKLQVNVFLFDSKDAIEARLIFFSTSVYLVCNHQEKFVLCACWFNKQRALCSKSYFRFRKKNQFYRKKQ